MLFFLLYQRRQCLVGAIQVVHAQANAELDVAVSVSVEARQH